MERDHALGQSQIQNSFERFTALGFDNERANRLARAEASLVEGTLKLNRCNRGKPTNIVDTIVHIFGITDHELIDDVLWKRFISALSSVPAGQVGFINLRLNHVSLEGEISSSLLRAFKMLPLQSLIVEDSVNGLPFALEALSTTPTLHLFGMHSCPIESKNDATALVKKLIGHSRLKELAIDTCQIGQNREIMLAFIPVLFRFDTISFDNNKIGSNGATLIANGLALNPKVNHMSLHFNDLRDGEISKIAASLKTNTNLRKLSLGGNKTTIDAINSLFDVLHACSSFNAAYDSNHTCAVDILPKVNRHENPRDNMLSKLILMTDICVGDLEEIPIELVPRLLALLQEGKELNNSQFNSLDAVFKVLREWTTKFVLPDHTNSGPCHALDKVGDLVDSFNKSL
ncbi:hypothetical protein ACHAWU_002667 [Discostella pseudostelligera]|uniref:Uncharacterized protein n=1 Tax=Discostella pseudostelligera TaxID=259834 RepID=A0ABD3MX08_9STRA